MTTVSIIIPCYNGEKFINRCLNSILEQSYLDMEIIIIDDGSTDDSKQLIQKWKNIFSKKNIEIKYIYQNNKGPASAINTGLKYIEGKYLSLLDVDDIFLENSIYERVNFLEKS